MSRLLEMHVLPVINENDTVATDEIAIGDNDTLAAIVAREINADLLVLLSDIEGLYTADPRKNPNAKKLERVKASEVLAMNLKAIDATATAFCLSTGMPIHVFGLKDPVDILSALEGKSVGTVITAE